MIQLDLQSRIPIYEQLVSKMSELISLGVLNAQSQLPSVRSLARDLGVNPNTVQKAYQELERRGVIYSVSGKGSFIAPGGNAGAMLLQQSLDKIRASLQEGKRSGVTQPQATELVKTVYEEETTDD